MEHRELQVYEKCLVTSHIWRERHMEGEVEVDEAYVVTVSVQTVLQTQISPWGFGNQCSLVVILDALVYLSDHKLVRFASRI